MASSSDRDRRDRVVLPGGETIEATPRAHASRERRAAATLRRPVDPADLHICPDCRSDLVQPITWEPSGMARWRVDLRCPECEWHGSAVHDQKTMDRFDEVLDDGTEALLADLTQLSRALMEEDVERFVDALHRDLIQPEDF